MKYMNEFIIDGSDNNEKLHTLPQSRIINELVGAEFASSYYCNPNRPTHTGREFSSDEIGDAVKPTVIYISTRPRCEHSISGWVNKYSTRQRANMSLLVQCIWAPRTNIAPKALPGRS
jgi:hypothetical protein